MSSGISKLTPKMRMSWMRNVKYCVPDSAVVWTLSPIESRNSNAWTITTYARTAPPMNRTAARIVKTMP